MQVCSGVCFVLRRLLCYVEIRALRRVPVSCFFCRVLYHGVLRGVRKFCHAFIVLAIVQVREVM